MKTLARLEKCITCWFIIFTSFLFFLLRLPSLFEPYWYGDEGIYQVLGLGINKHLLLYKEIFDNKPPLLYYLYSFFNSDQFLLRLVSLIFGIVSVWMFYKLSRLLFENIKASCFTTFVFAVLFALPTLEGNIANAENFMLLPIITAGYLIIKIAKHQTHIKYTMLFLTGLILSVAFLFKIVAIFDFAAFVAFLTVITAPLHFDRKKFKEYLLTEIKIILPFAVGFFIPMVIFAIYFFAMGAGNDFSKAVLFNNVGYVGYGNKLIIPQGFLIFKIILLATFYVLIFIKRGVLKPSVIFIWLWFAFSLFNAYFSQRPYIHYLLVLLPSITLLTGLLWEKGKAKKISFILVVLSLFFIPLSFHFYPNLASYYGNFLSFTAGKKDLYSYQKFFDSRTPTDYNLAEVIKLNTLESDNIFIWGNNAQVYKLVNKLPPAKYTVAYHITGYNDGIISTQDGLNKKNPKLIIIMPNVKDYPFSLSNYKEKYILENILIYERTF